MPMYQVNIKHQQPKKKPGLKNVILVANTEKIALKEAESFIQSAYPGHNLLSTEVERLSGPQLFQNLQFMECRGYKPKREIRELHIQRTEVEAEADAEMVDA